MFKIFKTWYIWAAIALIFLSDDPALEAMGTVLIMLMLTLGAASLVDFLVQKSRRKD